MTPRRLSALYVCYLSLEDPLVHTQVVSYLSGLAAHGHRVHLLTFETGRLTRARRRELRETLDARGVAWHGLRYHKRPSLPATVYDTLAGALYATLLVRRHRLEALHARSHVPAAMALIARRLLPRSRRPALIFDIRGLMAEEYVDAARWRDGGLPFRLTKAVERAGIARADGIVVLTDAVRRQLFGGDGARSVFVIPCCADLDALAAASGVRERRRAELGLTDATVMVYVGKFGGWYMEAEMAELFAVAKRSMPSLHFLILTQSNHAEIRRELALRGVHGDYTIASVSRELLGGHLAAADLGISFIRPVPSKVASSPTKVGEYLGAGLPVICTARIGDLDGLVTPDIGVLVGEHTEASYRSAIEHCVRLAASPESRRRCRAVAERELSLAEVGVPKYLRLYQDVAERIATQRRNVTDPSG